MAARTPGIRAFNGAISPGVACGPGDHRMPWGSKSAPPRPSASHPPGTPPPGSMGLPLIGETLSFIANPFRFLEVRRDRHGNVFKSFVLGRRIVFLAGTEGAEAFYDPANISRENAHFYQLADMFGGINMEMYDGPKHVALKTIALGAFDRAALTCYLPGMQRLIEATLSRLAA